MEDDEADNQDGRTRLLAHICCASPSLQRACLCYGFPLLPLDLLDLLGECEVDDLDETFGSLCHAYKDMCRQSVTGEIIRHTTRSQTEAWWYSFSASHAKLLPLSCFSVLSLGEFYVESTSCEAPSNAWGFTRDPALLKPDGAIGDPARLNFSGWGAGNRALGLTYFGHRLARNQIRDLLGNSFLFFRDKFRLQSHTRAST